MNENRALHQPSQLFTLRIWCQAVGDGRVEWRGQLRHVLSGETRYFRDWDLIDCLIAMLPQYWKASAGKQHADDKSAKSETE